MVRNEERRQRSPEHLRMPFARLFGGAVSATPARKHRPGVSADHERSHHGRGRSQEPDRGSALGGALRSRDRVDKGRDRDQDQDRRQRTKSKSRRKHDDGDVPDEDKSTHGTGTKHRHHHRHRNHSHVRPILRINLKSLDDRYSSWTDLQVRAGLRVLRLEPLIRRQYAEQDRDIAPDARFFFYMNGSLLEPGTKIMEDSSTVFYKMAKSSGDVDRWKFTHWQDETNGRLDSALSNELVRAIEEGATVRQLRKNIADYMEIDDPYRVVLTLRGGTRQVGRKNQGGGTLQGECWEVRQVQAWLSRWITVDINPPNRYIILKGLGREYVYHPNADTVSKGMEIRDIQTYMRKRLFPSVRMSGKSEVEVSLKNLTLSLEDSCPGSFTPIKWGETYTFEIPQDAAERFADEETWLLPSTESCAVCLEEKKVTEMPIRITSGCKHSAALCKECLKQWLQSGLERTTWDRLKCPDCPEMLQHADMKLYANAETFARYDTLATRSAVEALRNFRWCLSPTCESGQIDDENCAKFKCQACSARHCIRHNVPWHKGETCDEYDRRNKQRKKDDKASEQTIKKTSKKCPECKKDVHKFTGCNHITCVCGHEWCYICMAPFQRNEHGFLFCRHKPECTERDPFIDLIDPAHPRQNGARPVPMGGPMGGGPMGGGPNGGGPGFQPRPVLPPGFFPPFAPQHLRRQNAGGANGANGANRREQQHPLPPPGPLPHHFPFRNNGNRPMMFRAAAAAMAAAAAGGQINHNGGNRGGPPGIHPAFDGVRT